MRRLFIAGLAMMTASAAASETLRFATFNASLNRDAEGGLLAALEAGDDPQIDAVAEILQRVNADVVLINEFDFDPDAPSLLLANYLAAPRGRVAPLGYPHVFIAPSNTGVASGQDLDKNGEIGGPGDALGFGFFEGQYGMLVLSKFPIEGTRLRTFQTFLWKDMPGARLPVTEDGTAYYTSGDLDVLRLSSKSHWDVPIQVGDAVIHFLVSHPTPPVFDGPEDRNGTRNADEIRFWADYIAGADYMVDDGGIGGGLAPGAHFVIAGDLNSDPFDGDSLPGAAQQVTEHPLVAATPIPSSDGGPDAAQRQGSNNGAHGGDPAHDTADFGEAQFNGPGNLRVDYVLPSATLTVEGGGVFWPKEDDPLFALVGDFPPVSSDHRMVWIDVTLPE